MKGAIILVFLISQCTAQLNPTVLPKTETVSAATNTNIGGFPRPCLQVLASAGDNPYPPMSVARIYSMFCPVINEFANCLEQHLNESSAEYLLVLSRHFDKSLMVSRMQYLCSIIPAAAASLDSLMSNTSSDIAGCITAVSMLMKQQSQPMTLNQLCQALEDHVTCMKQYATPDRIPGSALHVYFSHVLVYTPGQCSLSIPSTQIPTISTPPAVNGSSDTWMLNSAVVRCGYETYGEVIANIMAAYMSPGNQNEASGAIAEAMQSFCQNSQRFSNCINQNLNPPYSPVDTALSTLINLKSIGSGLEQFCATSLSQSELMCLFQSGSSFPVCGSMISAAIQLLAGRSHSGIPSDGLDFQQDLLKYCPIFREGNACARIQLHRCSSSLAETFDAVEKQLLTTNCYNADSSVLDASPYLNRMAYCAVPIMAEAYQTFATRPWTIEDEHMVSFACKESSNFAACLSREVTVSRNLVDRMTVKLLDFNSGSRLQYIFETVCNQKNEILSLSQCIINATDNFRFCKMEQKYKDLQAQYIFNFVFNTSGIDVNGVTELCKPYKDLAVCNARQITGCSESLSQLAEDVVNELLTRDCGGSRPLTQYINFNSGTTQGIVTGLTCLMLLVNVIVTYL